MASAASAQAAAVEVGGVEFAAAGPSDRLSGPLSLWSMPQKRWTSEAKLASLGRVPILNLILTRWQGNWQLCMWSATSMLLA